MQMKTMRLALYRGMRANLKVSGSLFTSVFLAFSFVFKVFMIDSLSPCVLHALKQSGCI